MKNIHTLILASLFASCLFLACEKDEPVQTNPIDEEPIEKPEPTDPLEGLLPYQYQPIPIEGPVGHLQAIIQDSFLWEAGGAGFDLDSHPIEPGNYFGVNFYTVETWPDTFFLRENLMINEIPLNQKGNYAIGSDPWDYGNGLVGAMFFTRSDDGDVLEEIYIVDETATNNELTIDDFDEADQVYHGTFTISFMIGPDRAKSNPNNPDRFTLRNAVFNAKIL